MRVVAFTGMPGAGKSEAVEEARLRMLPIVSMGDIVRAAVRDQALPLTDENVGRVATRMRQQKGADWWARQTADEIERNHRKAPLVIIDGVRTLAEVQHFRRRLGPAFHLVAIEAPIEVRAERLRARGRLDDGATLDDVRKRDEREIAWGLLEAIGSADSRLRNEGALDAFRALVRHHFDRLTRKA